MSSQASARRKPAYVSPSTKSITISVNGGSATIVNNPTLASGGAGTETTTTTVPAPIGNDTFAVDAYDATGGGGSLLAQNTIPYTIVAGEQNIVNVTLEGNLAKIVCSAVAPYVTLTSAGPPAALQMVGPAGEIALEPEDADGNIIVAPGLFPSGQLALSGPAGQAVTSVASTNLFNVNVRVTGTPVALTASGTNLANAPVTSTCDVTRVLAMYVVNHGQDGVDPSVAIYPTSATSSSTPTATIAGSNTNQVQTQFVAVANTGQIYLSNNGPVPGATFGPTSGYVDVYPPAANGNVAPASVMTGFNQPTGLAFDPSGNLFLVTAETVNEYPPGAGAGSSPTSVIEYTASGAAADCYGDDVDVNGLLYLACQANVLVFAKGASGLAAPTENISLNTSETDYFPSWLGVTASSTIGTAGSIYAPTFNNNQSQVDDFAAGSNSTSLPTIITGTGINQPFDIFMDPTGAFYLTNYGNSTVGIYSSATLLTTGLATETISTGISYPYGVTVE